MAQMQQFRSSLNGFNREDVVGYIEYLNNFYTNQIQQLNNQLQAALAKAPAQEETDLRAQLDEALAKCDALEKQLAEKSGNSETAERMATARVQQLYAQANAILAEAALMAEKAAAQVVATAQQASLQVQTYHESVLSAKEQFQKTAASLSSLRCEENEVV